MTPLFYRDMDSTERQQRRTKRINRRNQHIRQDHRRGSTLSELQSEWRLSQSTLQQILRGE